MNNKREFNTEPQTNNLEVIMRVDENGNAVNEVADAPVDEGTQTALLFVNDFTDDDKAAIKKAVSEKIDELLDEPELSINDMSHLAQVAHGSIKSRAKQTGSAREIVLGVLNGTRSTRTPSVNATSVKTFIASLSDEDKQKMLDEILGK